MRFIQVIQQVVMLFIIIGIGYFLRSKKIISREGIKSFSALIFQVTMPAWILVALATTQTASSGDVLEVGLATALSYTFLFLVAMVMPKIMKVPEKSKGLYRFMTLFGNVGFVGFPIITAILGKEALFMAALFNIPYTLLIYTVGIYFVMADKKGEKEFSIELKKILNPGVFMTLLGLGIFFVGGLEGIEATNNSGLILGMTTLLDLAAMIGAVTTPLAMLVVGGSLYGVRIGHLYKNYRVILFSLIRMIVFPLIVGLGLTLLGLGHEVVAVAIILVGMPVATGTVIIANQYDGDILEASEAVFISTVLILATAPILMLIITFLT